MREDEGWVGVGVEYEEDDSVVWVCHHEIHCHLLVKGRVQ